MPKRIKVVIAILLLPLCIGAVTTLLRVLRASGHAELIWVATLGGAACWLAVFLILPKPMKIYVLGHELTHALWTWLFGGKVKKFKVTAKGGHVIITRSNFVIVLAPYFFPLYVVAVVLVFVSGHLLFGWMNHAVWFHLLIGAAYAFHVTLTWHALQTQQSDITSQGYFFSAVIIFLGNISVLLFGVPWLTGSVRWLTAMGWWLQDSGAVLLRLRQLF